MRFLQPSLLQLALLWQAKTKDFWSVVPVECVAREGMLWLAAEVRAKRRRPRIWVCVAPVATILSKAMRTQSLGRVTAGLRSSGPGHPHRSLPAEPWGRGKTTGDRAGRHRANPSGQRRCTAAADETVPGAVKPSGPSSREAEDLPLEGCEALPKGIPSSAQPLQPRLCGWPPPWARPASQPAKANFKDTAPSSSESSRSLGLLELARVGERLLRAAKSVLLVAEELRVNALGGHVLVADGLLDACARRGASRAGGERDSRTLQGLASASNGGGEMPAARGCTVRSPFRWFLYVSADGNEGKQTRGRPRRGTSGERSRQSQAGRAATSARRAASAGVQVPVRRASARGAAAAQLIAPCDPMGGGSGPPGLATHGYCGETEDTGQAGAGRRGLGGCLAARAAAARRCREFAGPASGRPRAPAAGNRAPQHRPLPHALVWFFCLTMAAGPGRSGEHTGGCWQAVTAAVDFLARPGRGLLCRCRPSRGRRASMFCCRSLAVSLRTPRARERRPWRTASPPTFSRACSSQSFSPGWRPLSWHSGRARAEATLPG